ncbi:unnamed protein product, partial [Discosporangium mesarthrocarpum]
MRESADSNDLRPLSGRPLGIGRRLSPYFFLDLQSKLAARDAALKLPTQISKFQDTSLFSKNEEKQVEVEAHDEPNSRGAEYVEDRAGREDKSLLSSPQPALSPSPVQSHDGDLITGDDGDRSPSRQVIPEATYPDHGIRSNSFRVGTLDPRTIVSSAGPSLQLETSRPCSEIRGSSSSPGSKAGDVGGDAGSIGTPGTFAVEQVDIEVKNPWARQPEDESRKPISGESKEVYEVERIDRIASKVEEPDSQLDHQLPNHTRSEDPGLEDEEDTYSIPGAEEGEQEGMGGEVGEVGEVVGQGGDNWDGVKDGEEGGSEEGEMIVHLDKDLKTHTKDNEEQQQEEEGAVEIDKKSQSGAKANDDHLKESRDGWVYLEGFHVFLPIGRLQRFMEKNGCMVKEIYQLAKDGKQRGRAYVTVRGPEEAITFARELDGIPMPVELQGDGDLLWAVGYTGSAELEASAADLSHYSEGDWEELRLVTEVGRRRGEEMEANLLRGRARQVKALPSARCANFAKGKCFFGDTCRFNHFATDRPGGGIGGR